MAETNRDDLAVSLRETADGTAYELGITLEGAFLAFARFVPTQVDTAIADAKAQADEQAAQARADARAQADAEREQADAAAAAEASKPPPGEPAT